jgi:hypothetical protein
MCFHQTSEFCYTYWPLCPDVVLVVERSYLHSWTVEESEELLTAVGRNEQVPSTAVCSRRRRD